MKLTPRSHPHRKLARWVRNKRTEKGFVGSKFWRELDIPFSHGSAIELGLQFHDVFKPIVLVKIIDVLTLSKRDIQTICRLYHIAVGFPQLQMEDIFTREDLWPLFIADKKKAEDIVTQVMKPIQVKTPC